LYFGALDRCVSLEGLESGQKVGKTMISVLIGILIICVVGAICFWAIDKFVRDARLANLLKLLVVLICLAAILQRVLPLAGIGGL
jgi:NhaP-type Na+/H+ or K+/H+ antiporter